MNRIQLLSMSLFVSIAACKQPKNSSSAPASAPAPLPAATAPAASPQISSDSSAPRNEEPMQEEGANARKESGDSLSRFIVSFYSIGSGSEGDQMNNLKMFTTQFGKRISKNITWSETPWGREGEVDFCFSLKDLTTEQQTEFINGAKQALNKAQWVHYFENKACRKAR